MQANWSITLNLLLLIGVIAAIWRMVKIKRRHLNAAHRSPSMGQMNSASYDDVISVRKLAPVLNGEDSVPDLPDKANRQKDKTVLEDSQEYSCAVQTDSEPSILMFLLAKENRQLAGYELLQNILAVGLRFGESHLFHRHQHSNGQGPILCSLAAATPSGIFDLQNIGAFSVRGLCLFMQASGNQAIDRERFEIMLDTARQLSEGLDAYLLDDKRQPLTESALQAYYHRLNLVN